VVEGKGFVGPALNFLNDLYVTLLQSVEERSRICNTGATRFAGLG